MDRSTNRCCCCQVASAFIEQLERYRKLVRATLFGTFMGSMASTAAHLFGVSAAVKIVGVMVLGVSWALFLTCVIVWFADRIVRLADR